MKFSYNWLQDHIVEKLPLVTEIEDVLSRKSLEVEEVVGDILEVKVLPHRQHDVLSHRGLAREIVTLFGFTNKIIEVPEAPVDANVATPKVVVEDSKRCFRYAALRVDGVAVTESPLWLKEKLESIGQRSISNVVDITNFVMNDIGQPMHAFDANKVAGKISVRIARAGETMRTLDDRALVLNGTETVIADEEGVLALAGVKGGNRAIVDENTTSIIFESANFDATTTRKTSDLHNIHTDSSKRYEAAMTSEFAKEGILLAASHIHRLVPGCRVGALVDVYPRPEKHFTLGVSVREVNELLGSSYTKNDVENVLTRCNFDFEKIVPKEYIKSLIPQVLDKPYNRLASTLYDAPDNFSCGSLVNWIYVQCGYPSPRIAIDMYFASQHITKDELVFGDFVFTNTLTQKPKDSMIYSHVLNMNIPDVPVYTKTVEFMPGSEFPKGIDHVGLYIGDGKVLHTSSAIGHTVIEDLDKSETFKNECWFGRLVKDLSIEQCVVRVPFERLDIRIKEDLIEEVGRIMGYDNLPSVLPELPRTGVPHKRLYYENKIKNILFECDFSEMYTYTFGNKGEVSIVKGLASDKEKLRANLGDGVLEALQMNLRNAPLLGLTTIKVFEIGNVFTHDKEWRSFSLGIDDGKKKSNFADEIDKILSRVSNELKGGEVPYVSV
ncbi:MAG: phenylalanine--tRNA ligase beta subunit-related protein, partial [Minisyncoccota bacterium]